MIRSGSGARGGALVEQESGEGGEERDCKTFGVTPDHGRCIDDQ
jgi:hypothetical protein